MDVEWTVAIPGAGRPVPSPTRSDARAYGNRLRQLVEQRWGLLRSLEGGDGVSCPHTVDQRRAGGSSSLR
jgi:hypothetical protein